MDKPRKPSKSISRKKYARLNNAKNVVDLIDKLKIDPSEIEIEQGEYAGGISASWQEREPDPSYSLGLKKYKIELEMYIKGLKALIEDAEKDLNEANKEEGL